jgi:uncharacterized protein (TIGR00730 family)
MTDNHQEPKAHYHEPLTRKELHEATKARLSAIDKEFNDGFKFVEQYQKSVSIFGSARFDETNPYYIQARSLTARIADSLGYAVLTGGGPGIMEAANRGAFEAGGKSIGLTIELPHSFGRAEIRNPYLTDNLDFFYFFSRKVMMSFCAEAYVFFPGGFGTLDEFFEIITLVQTRKIEKVPIILVGADFWRKVDSFLKDELLSRGAIDDTDLALYSITDDEDEIMDIIRSAPVRIGLKFDHDTEYQLEPAPQAQPE